MKDLGNAKKILGIVINRNRHENKLTMSQESYVNMVITKFGTKDAKSVTIPPYCPYESLNCHNSPKIDNEVREIRNILYANVIISIMFSTITTRPDLTYAISFLSRFMSNLERPHWAGLKWLLRDIAGTLNIGLTFEKRFKLLVTNIKKIYYYILFYIRNKLHYLEISITTYSYLRLNIEPSLVYERVLWLKEIIIELNFLQKVPIVLTYSQSVLLFSKNPVYHERSKHIEVKYSS